MAIALIQPILSIRKYSSKHHLINLLLILSNNQLSRMCAAFDPFANLNGGPPKPRQVNSLVPGIKYECTRFYSQQSKFTKQDGTTPYNTVVEFVDGGLQFKLILPKLYDNQTHQWMESMNTLITAHMPPFIVFYGKCGIDNVIDILQFHEAVNVSKLAAIRRLQGNAPSTSPTT
ncbi:ADP-ribosylation factor-like protein 9 [Frankliniella fusca]|uniref:ADP-ribosylation factor-like protein 9 n=1 Tax=Frankliniella fusca TaxID=407009 RepID=A0AAE1L8G9_9NEOP|nr:ADP-ribosylation factor-like protein 9 [Frankliniella fusca]